jgi:cytosine/adenosine deaminase-related metal-dependent hydrolase
LLRRLGRRPAKPIPGSWGVTALPRAQLASVPARLAARWVVPVEGRPIERGALLIADDGRIAAVGQEETVPRPDGVSTETYDDAILLPGLVNAHTHLELTGLGSGPPGPDFAEWIRQLRERKAGRTPADFLAAARIGVAGSHAAGVTTVADTGDSGAVPRALAEAGGSGVVYQEVFGPDPARLAESFEGLQAAVARLSEFSGRRIRIGVSPHAPYTVSGPLYQVVAEWAAAESLPVAVHLAESAAEGALLQAGTGAFADVWRRRGIPLPSPLGMSPVGWLDRHGVLGERTLCIHVVQVSAADLDRLARASAAIAHCPLSNRAHGHGTAPLADFLERGIRVGLGTDSEMSIGTLDLLAEARAARASSRLTAGLALELCTLGGARAIGLEQEIGSLQPGKWGDCVVIRPRTGIGGSPAEAVLASGPADVLATYIGGKAVYRALHRL